MSTLAPLNQDTLDLLRSLEEDQPGSLARLIRIFVADAPALLSRIEVANERRDREDLKSAAHYLRSSALALGADDLAATAQQVEHLAPEQLCGVDAAQRLLALRTGLRDAVLSLLQHTAEL